MRVFACLESILLIVYTLRKILGMNWCYFVAVRFFYHWVNQTDTTIRNSKWQKPTSKETKLSFSIQTATVHAHRLFQFSYITKKATFVGILKRFSYKKDLFVVINEYASWSCILFNMGMFQLIYCLRLCGSICWNLIYNTTILCIIISALLSSSLRNTLLIFF